jgi:hypothetical protein
MVGSGGGAVDVRGPSCSAVGLLCGSGRSRRGLGPGSWGDFPSGGCGVRAERSSPPPHNVTQHSMHRHRHVLHALGRQPQRQPTRPGRLTSRHRQLGPQPVLGRTIQLRQQHEPDVTDHVRGADHVGTCPASTDAPSAQSSPTTPVRTRPPSADSPADSRRVASRPPARCTRPAPHTWSGASECHRRFRLPVAGSRSSITTYQRSFFFTTEPRISTSPHNKRYAIAIGDMNVSASTDLLPKFAPQNTNDHHDQTASSQLTTTEQHRSTASHTEIWGSIAPSSTQSKNAL